MLMCREGTPLRTVQEIQQVAKLKTLDARGPHNLSKNKISKTMFVLERIIAYFFLHCSKNLYLRIFFFNFMYVEIQVTCE